MLEGASPSKLEPGAEPKSLNSQGQPSRPCRGLHVGTQLGCSEPQRPLWRGLGSKEYKPAIILCSTPVPAVSLLQSPPTTSQPQNHFSTLLFKDRNGGNSCGSKWVLFQDMLSWTICSGKIQMGTKWRVFPSCTSPSWLKRRQQSYLIP